MKYRKTNKFTFDKKSFVLDLSVTMEIIMADTIYNNQNVIDSRDVVERIEELQTLCENFMTENGLEEYPGFKNCDEESKWFDWDLDEGEELYYLQDFVEQYGNLSAWKDGLTLVRDSYFGEYAEDLAYELYDIKSDQWPFTCIDWGEAANELKNDYTCLDFHGEDYWASNY